VESHHPQAVEDIARDDQREPLAIRKLARRLGCDAKSVHSDASVLLKAGVIGRTEDGRIEFPYNEIHVDFVLRAA
jgi:predicted transcriptional regulator